MTGPLGASAAGLRGLARTADRTASRRCRPALASAHRRPVARIREGVVARAAGATACIDVSDGLLADVTHLADASGVGLDLVVGDGRGGRRGHPGRGARRGRGLRAGRGHARPRRRCWPPSAGTGCGPRWPSARASSVGGRCSTGAAAAGGMAPPVLRRGRPVTRGRSRTITGSCRDAVTGRRPSGSGRPVRGRSPAEAQPGKERIGRLVTLPDADAGRADVESLGGAVHDGAHLLDVGIPTTLGPPVGVTDVHSERRLLAADLAHRCHDTPTSSKNLWVSRKG